MLQVYYLTVLKIMYSYCAIVYSECVTDCWT